MDGDFQPLPAGEAVVACWPTLRRDLFSDPSSYAARTRVNPAYGLPGWTRDGGRRFHGGLDIAPLRQRPAGYTVRLEFTDPATGAEYPSDEPVWLPDDEVFAVLGGTVAEAVTREEESDFGCHIVLRHRWPGSGLPFFTLYGHLAGPVVAAGQLVAAGARLGRMGTTSRLAGARLWMAAAPHLHFEVRDGANLRHDPLEFLRRFLPR